MSVAETLIVRAEADGGVTLDQDGTEPAFGYMVGVPGFGITVSLGDPDAIAMVSQWFNSLSPDPGMCFGSWRDGETIYLDLSQRFDNLFDAMEACRKRKELALWCLHTKTEHRV